MKQSTLSNRHAYLIMCHTNFDQLMLLLELLDDKRNDIYLHIDKKATGYSLEQIRNCVHQSELTFVRPITVSWGGDSQIKAEIRLLKEATKTYHSYYHLLSGMDLPLKTQDEIHRFFAKRNGTDFVAFERNHPHNITKSFMDRLDYYYLFQNKIGRSTDEKSMRLKKRQDKDCYKQKKKGVCRTKNKSITFCKGSNWFSITHAAACYAVKESGKYRRIFRFTYCADEVFLQTILANSPLRDQIEDDDLRLIDWNKRGTEKYSPYTYREADYDMLIHSAENRLFARKFDEKVDKNIINKIYSYLQNEQIEH